jgi:hypothetical protein
MRGITRQTLGRLIDHKGGLAGIAMMAIGIWIVATSDWHSVRVTFEQGNSGATYAPVDEVALRFLSTYASIVVGVICLMAAGVIPGLFGAEKSWFYFSRPLSRGRILVENVWGIFIVYEGLLFVTLLPVGLVAILRYPLFDSRIAEIFLVHVFNCGAWLILICALGVLLRGTVKVIFVSLGIWVAQMLLMARSEYLGSLTDSIVEPILGAAAFVLPRMSQLGESTHATAAGVPVNLLTPILMTLLSVGLTLYLASASLNRRDL